MNTSYQVYKRFRTPCGSYALLRSVVQDGHKARWGTEYGYSTQVEGAGLLNVVCHGLGSLRIAQVNARQKIKELFAITGDE